MWFLKKLLCMKCDLIKMIRVFQKLLVLSVLLLMMGNQVAWNAFSVYCTLILAKFRIFILLFFIFLNYFHIFFRVLCISTRIHNYVLRVPVPLFRYTCISILESYIHLRLKLWTKKYTAEVRPILLLPSSFEIILVQQIIWRRTDQQFDMYKKKKKNYEYISRSRKSETFFLFNNSFSYSKPNFISEKWKEDHYLN